MADLGVIAAGHPVTAQAGADVLRNGGNAVDAAVGAMLASLACEPMLTALGAGGDMLVVAPDSEAVLLAFFVAAPGLADALERLAAEGPEPFYSGDIAAAIVEWLAERGGMVTAADLDAYTVIDRRPVSADYRGREVLTNPPPSAGGILIARALGWLDDAPAPPDLEQIVAVMKRTQSERTQDFLAGLDDPSFVERFLHGPAGPGPLGSTTHIAVLDGDGRACSVTCSNGSCSSVVVPGTGVHLNNMLGETDLNPLGFHRHPPGRRLPSMMAPTVVPRDGVAELVLAIAGPTRIRSA